MPRLWRFRPEGWDEFAKVRVGGLAGRQFGRVSRAQLCRLGVSTSTICRWGHDGYLRPALPRVYAVGHVGPSVEADLFAAVLYAGPGAMLSHTTAAWWRGLINFPGHVISLSTPRRSGSRPGIQVHARRALQRELHRQIPVTTIEQTLLDLASEADLLLVRKALATLDYQGHLKPELLRAACGYGRAGSARLTYALARFEPRFAQTNGPLEDGFLVFCERQGVPLPEVNVLVHGVRVDAHWPAQRLVVELDGGGNHGTWAQLKRDKANDLHLRGHGLTVLRYDWDQIHGEPQLVRDDILRALAAGQD